MFSPISLVGVCVRQVEHAAERYKILQSNAESYRKEIAALQDKCQKYSTSIAKHEQTITKLKEVKRANTAHDVYFGSCKANTAHDVYFGSCKGKHRGKHSS